MLDDSFINLSLRMMKASLLFTFAIITLIRKAYDTNNNISHNSHYNHHHTSHTACNLNPIIYYQRLKTTCCLLCQALLNEIVPWYLFLAFYLDTSTLYHLLVKQQQHNESNNNGSSDKNSSSSINSTAAAIDD